MSQLGLAPVAISVTSSSGIGTNAKNLRGRSRDIRDRMSPTRQPRTCAYFEITPQRNNSSRPPLRRRTIDYLSIILIRVLSIIVTTLRIKPDLAPGRYVMLGGPTRRNFYWSGVGWYKLLWPPRWPFIIKPDVPISSCVTQFASRLGPYGPEDLARGKASYAKGYSNDDVCAIPNPLGRLLAATVMWSSLSLFVLKIIWNLCLPYAMIHEGIRHPENADSVSLFTFLEIGLLLGHNRPRLGGWQGPIRTAQLGVYGVCAIFVTYINMIVICSVARYKLGPFPTHVRDRHEGGSNE